MKISKKVKRIKESEEKKVLTWDDFSDPVSDRIEEKFLPRSGEGTNLMSQAVTATSKLIYKWFNDGDVFDNTYGLEGWANDLSSYANWLDSHIPETQGCLARIKSIKSDENAYTQLLYDLLHIVMNDGMVNKYWKTSAEDTIYDCDGPYEFKEATYCPECGNECDDEDYSRYGMCYDCWYQQQYETDYEDEEDEYDDDEMEESVKRLPRSIVEAKKKKVRKHTAYKMKEGEDADWAWDLKVEKKSVRKAMPAASDNEVTIKAAGNIAKKYHTTRAKVLATVKPSNNLKGDRTWNKEGKIVVKEDRSLGRQLKTWKQVRKGDTVVDSDEEPWTVIEKGSVAELNEKYPECKLYDAEPYKDAVYVGDPICSYGHEDKGNRIFVYDDSWQGALAYFNDYGFYISESKKRKSNLKESYTHYYVIKNHSQDVYNKYNDEFVGDITSDCVYNDEDDAYCDLADYIKKHPEDEDAREGTVEEIERWEIEGYTGNGMDDDEEDYDDFYESRKRKSNLNESVFKITFTDGTAKEFESFYDVIDELKGRLKDKDDAEDFEEIDVGEFEDHYVGEEAEKFEGVKSVEIPEDVYQGLDIDDGLTDDQKDMIKEMVQTDFECGQSENDHDELVSLLKEDECFEGVEEEAADYYMELLSYGPAGFYEEFKDELDFDPDFIAEYGDEEDEDDEDDEDFDESKKNPKSSKLNELTDEQLSKVVVAYKADDPNRTPLVDGQGVTYAVSYEKDKSDKFNVDKLKAL